MRTPKITVSLPHPYAWIWEPLEMEPTLILKPMFGMRALYLEGKLCFCFATKQEPWRGVLVATERTNHDSLITTFPALAPHSILPKWLYLAESSSTFERDATTLVRLAKQRDARLGIIPKLKKSKRRSVKE